MAPAHNVKVFLTSYMRDAFLTVVVGLDSPHTEASVNRIIKKNNIAIGIMRDGFPVFIRIDKAQDIDKTFRSINKRLSKRIMPTKTQIDHLIKKSTLLIHQILKNVESVSPCFRTEEVSKISMAYN